MTVRRWGGATNRLVRTLADAIVLESIASRLRLLRADAQPHWGVMTPVQMAAHMEGAFQMAVGAMPVASQPLPLARCWRSVALRSPFRWPPSLPTIPELDLRRIAVPADEFTDRTAHLIEQVSMFPALPPGSLIPAHPLLGSMTRWEWMRWGYLHTDHHLRQFGC